MWNGLLAELQESNAATTLISSEAFVEASDTAPEILANIVADHAAVQIICYIRPQGEWIESVFNEVVKNDYRRETGKIMSLREVMGGYIDYYSTIKLWANVFGARNVQVRPFQKSRFVGGTIFSDFLCALGDPVLENTIIPSPLNVSIHPTYVEFLRRCNLIPMLNGMHTQLVECIEQMAKTEQLELPDIPEGACRLDEAEQQHLAEMANACNSKIHKEFHSASGTRQSERFFDDEHPSSRKYLDSDYLLTAKAEHAIFDRLPPEIISHFEAMRGGIAKRNSDHHFLPRPSENTLERMLAVALRQEIEANWLYSLIDQMKHEQAQRERAELAQKLADEAETVRLQVEGGALRSGPGT